MRPLWVLLAGLTLGVVTLPACKREEPGSEAVIDLVDAFSSTEVGATTTVIRAGDRAGRDHFLEGWSAAETDGDGHAIVWITSPRAQLWFDAGHQPVEATLVLTYVGSETPARAAFILLRLNGRPLGRVRLVGGEQEIRRALPIAQQLAGRNVLDVFAPGAYMPARRNGEMPRRFGLRSIRLEPIAPRPPAPYADGDRLILPAGTGVTYFVRLPRAPSLSFDSRENGLRLAVQADGARERTVSPMPRDGNRTALDLGPEGGAIARLTLTAASNGPIALVRPRIQGRTARNATASPTTPHASNLILYVADTLRADHLGCYGYRRATSPRLDAFARESIVFERTLAQASWTRPATASIPTGRYPQEHGARSLMSAVRGDVPTMATLLRQAGRDTAAFVTNLNVAGRFGFDRGFAEFHYLEERDDRDTVYLSAPELNAAAFPWIEAHRGHPFFLYLHASDVHAPYRPPPRYAERFQPANITPTITPRTPLRALLERPALATSDNITLLAALYDGEIALLDEAFGALLDRLHALTLDRSTLVVFVADHGEEFHEHGGFDHGRTLYEELVRVPLLMRLPGAANGGRRVGGLARQIDVLPTVLVVLGVTAPPDLPGTPLLGPRAALADETLMETHLGRPPLVGVVAGRWKAVWSEATAGRDGVELYDLTKDTAERQNLASERPVVVGYARQTAARLNISRAPAPPAAETTIVDPETERRLRALGYVD